MTYTVYSKSKNSDWVVERSYEAKIYAEQLANAINKRTDRKAKIVKRMAKKKSGWYGERNRHRKAALKRNRKRTVTTRTFDKWERSGKAKLVKHAILNQPAVYKIDGKRYYVEGSGYSKTIVKIG